MKPDSKGAADAAKGAATGDAGAGASDPANAGDAAGGPDTGAAAAIAAQAQLAADVADLRAQLAESRNVFQGQHAALLADINAQLDRMAQVIASVREHVVALEAGAAIAGDLPAQLAAVERIARHSAAILARHHPSEVAPPELGNGR